MGESHIIKQHHQGAPSERSEQYEPREFRAPEKNSDWFDPALDAPLLMETHEQVGGCYHAGGAAASVWESPVGGILGGALSRSQKKSQIRGMFVVI